MNTQPNAPPDTYRPDAPNTSGQVEHLLARARDHVARREASAARRVLARLLDTTESFRVWQAAAAVADRVLALPDPQLRPLRVALLGSYTTSQLPGLLRPAGLRFGLRVEVYEAAYGQYRQEILDPESGLYRFAPDVVILAVHAGDLALPWHADDPTAAVQTEAARWQGLWQRLADRSRARIVQHNFAVPPERPLGHLTARLPGSRPRLIDALNERLAAAAGAQVTILDCDWMASLIGKARWFDDKHWYLAKQAVAPAALPTLARHTAAVLAAEAGLTRKCLVVDLDDTLWGGIVGEDGPDGIRLDGPTGEAHLALQDYLIELRHRGVILAAASKNNEADALEVFHRRPEMRLRLDDLAVIVANWNSKPANLRQIAERLNIGVDALVFLDDNPAERELVRQQLPEVEVIEPPADPSGLRHALAASLLFEPAAFTPEDAGKTAQYKARADIAQLEAQAASLEDFWSSLQMRATVAPFDEQHLPRIAQLIAKTNQFNLTTRRHNLAAIQQMLRDPAVVHLYLKLSDRFADHGLVGVLIAREHDAVLDIDTWLMSCRVIGRSADTEMLMHLCHHALTRGCTRLQGTYIPTPKNQLVQHLYRDHGFTLANRNPDGTTAWTYDLATDGPITNDFCGNQELLHGLRQPA